MPTPSSIKANADKGPPLDGYLSAFGISASDPYAFPKAFKLKYEDDWDNFVRKYGVVDTSEMSQVLRVLAFAQSLAKKGRVGLYILPLEVRGKKVTVREIYEQLVQADMNRAAFTVLTMLRKTDLFLHMKAVKTKLDIVGDQLVTTIQFDRRRANDTVDQILTRTKDILRLSVIPPQLKDRVRPGLSAAVQKKKNISVKPKFVTPKVESLLNQFQSQFGWFPLVRSRSFSAQLIRARDQKLVLRVQIQLDARLIQQTKRATIFRLWNTAFRTSIK